MTLRVVADTNVLVAAAISPEGVCGRLLTAALDGRWSMVASPALIRELTEVLQRRKFRRWLTADDAQHFAVAISHIAEMREDPVVTPSVTRDPDDDYLVALAQAANVDAIVSGDPHLTELQISPPVRSPAELLAMIDG